MNSNLPLFPIFNAARHSPEIEEWERSFETLIGVQRLTENKFSYLQAMLDGCEAPDSYLTSPNYYLFTGRLGLWTYESEGAFLLICWHPNVPGKILIFPQLKKLSHNLMPELLAMIPAPPHGIAIARVETDKMDMYAAASNGLRQINLRATKEEVLDWQFPVHILSTKTVMDLVGNKFMHIRNRLRQTHKRSVKLVPFDAIHHSRSIENILHAWAKHNADNQLEYEQIYAPYDNLFSSSMNASFGLSGLMIYIDGELQAVALWDVSNTRQKTANLFVNFCNVSVKGLSELLMVKSCEALHNQGVEYLNLGGSETAGLNRFKSKFCPSASIDLCSIEVAIEDNIFKISNLQNPEVAA